GAVRIRDGAGPIVDMLPPTPGHFPVSIAIDDTFAFFTDVDNATRVGTVVRVRKTGGERTVIWPLPGEAPFLNPFFIEEVGPVVYHLSMGHMGARVLRDGGGGQEPILDGNTAGLAITNFDGHDFIYWTDSAFGGVVWRAQLD